MHIEEFYSYNDSIKEQEDIKKLNIIPFYIKSNIPAQLKNIKHLITFLSDGFPLSFFNINSSSSEIGEFILCKSSVVVQKMFGLGDYCEIQSSGKNPILYWIYPIVYWTNSYISDGQIKTVPSVTYLKLSKTKAMALNDKRIKFVKDYVCHNKIETPESFDLKIGDMDWLRFRDSNLYSKDILKHGTLMNKIWEVKRFGTGSSTVYTFDYDSTRGFIDPSKELNHFTSELNSEGKEYKKYSVKAIRKFPSAGPGSLLEEVYMEQKWKHYKDKEVNWASPEEANLFFLFYFMSTPLSVYNLYGKPKPSTFRKIEDQEFFSNILNKKEDSDTFIF